MLPPQVIKVFEKSFAKRGMQGPHIKEAIAEAVEQLEVSPPEPMEAPADETTGEDAIASSLCDDPGYTPDGGDAI